MSGLIPAKRQQGGQKQKDLACSVQCGGGWWVAGRVAPGGGAGPERYVAYRGARTLAADARRGAKAGVKAAFALAALAESSY